MSDYWSHEVPTVPGWYPAITKWMKKSMVYIYLDEEGEVKCSNVLHLNVLGYKYWGPKFFFPHSPEEEIEMIRGLQGRIGEGK